MLRDENISLVVRNFVKESLGRDYPILAKLDQNGILCPQQEVKIDSNGFFNLSLYTQHTVIYIFKFLNSSHLETRGEWPVVPPWGDGYGSLVLSAQSGAKSHKRDAKKMIQHKFYNLVHQHGWSAFSWGILQYSTNF